MQRLDWRRIEDELNGHGCAVLPGLLEVDACLALAAQYDRPERFRCQSRPRTASTPY